MTASHPHCGLFCANIMCENVTLPRRDNPAYTKMTATMQPSNTLVVFLVLRCFAGTWWTSCSCLRETEVKQPVIFGPLTATLTFKWSQVALRLCRCCYFRVTAWASAFFFFASCGSVKPAQLAVDGVVTPCNALKKCICFPSPPNKHPMRACFTFRYAFTMLH